MNEFIITFRECLEASLIIGIIYTVLDKNDLVQEKRVLGYGVLASIAASIFVGFLLTSINSYVGNTSYEKLFEALFMYITAGILFYVIFWLAKHVSNRKEIEKSVKTAIAGSGLALFLLVFFAILREGFETALFLIASVTNTGSFSYSGFSSGMILAIILGYLVVVQGRKVDLRVFFRNTTLLLVFFAAGMVAYGTHEAEEYFVKSGKIETKAQPLIHEAIQTTGNLFSLDYPFIRSIKKALEIKIENYKNQFKDSEQGFIRNWPKDYALRAWMLSMKTGGFIKSHNHRYGWITGSFYVKVPKKYDQSDSGNISFSYQGPEYPTNDKNFNPIVKKVETRDICIFPSSLFHQTIPFDGQEDRICLVFDLIQKK